MALEWRHFTLSAFTLKRVFGAPGSCSVNNRLALEISDVPGPGAPDAGAGGQSARGAVPGGAALHEVSNLVSILI